MASLKLIFQQEADPGWSNNKQTSLSIISIMKNWDFIRMSLWVFPVHLGLHVRTLWLFLLPGNCLSLFSVCQDEPRDGFLRAIFIYIWINDQNPSAQQALSTWSYILDPFHSHTQSQTGYNYFFKTLYFIFVRRPWLLKLSKVGEPPVPIFNLLKQNINHTVFPFLEMPLKLWHYPVVIFGLLKKNFNVSHYSPVQPGQWGGFFPSGLQKLRFGFS